MTRDAVARVHTLAHDLARAARLARGAYGADGRELVVVGRLLAVLDDAYAPLDVAGEVPDPCTPERLAALAVVEAEYQPIEYDGEVEPGRYVLVQESHFSGDLYLTVHPTIGDLLAYEDGDELAADWQRVAVLDLDRDGAEVEASCIPALRP